MRMMICFEHGVGISGRVPQFTICLCQDTSSLSDLTTSLIRLDYTLWLFVYFIGVWPPEWILLSDRFYVIWWFLTNRSGLT